MNLQKPAQPAQKLQPPPRQLQSFCCEWKQCCLWRAPFSFAASHLQSHGKNLRHRPVGDTIVTFHDPARAVREPTAKATEGTTDWQPVLSSTQPSSQSTQLLGIHLLDVPGGHLLCPTDRFGYRNQPSVPVLYQPKSASTQTERRITITLPSALQRELPISYNLKMPLSP